MAEQTGLFVDLGAGDNPHPNADVGVDIREGAKVEHTGVDLGTDRWPFENDSINRVHSADFLEHVPRGNLKHLFRELERVLQHGATALFITPLAGGFRAQSSPTHRGPGGFNPRIQRSFNEDKWEYAHMNLQAEAWAEMQFMHTIEFTVNSGPYAAQLIKIPGVEGHTHLSLMLE